MLHMTHGVARATVIISENCHVFFCEVGIACKLCKDRHMTPGSSTFSLFATFAVNSYNFRDILLILSE